MPRRSTTIQIDCVEQYEAINDLMRMLNTRFRIPSALTVIKEVDWKYGGDFERCSRCDRPSIDCRGHDDDVDYGREYDDGDSFYD